VIIDSHMHLAKSEGFGAEAYAKYGMSFPKETTDIDYLVGRMKSIGIGKAVAMGQAMNRIFDTSFGEDWVLEGHRKHPDFFIPFCSVEAIDKGDRYNKPALEYLKKAVLEKGCKGVLLAPPFGHYHSNVNAAYPFYEFADEQGIVVQFHHSAQIGKAILAPTKYTTMFDLNDLVLDFPNMKIVIEHLGYPWSEHLFTLMATDENLWTDLAMCYDRRMWTTWNLILAKEYGVLHRIMFASDFVACNFDLFTDDPAKDIGKWIDFVRKDLNEICRGSGWPLFTEAEIDGLLYKNAAKLYRV
jgi:predicted TIM-barrel fold metal-dependent hydrolase